MKVLQIFNELKPSGGEVMIEIASEIFKNNDLDIDVLSTGEIVGDYKDNFIARGYKVFHIPFSNVWRVISPIFL